MNFRDVGDRLYLTPYIQRGDIATARNLALVSDPMEGLTSIQQLESYAGYITVDANTDSHIFFWFFPASVSSLGLQCIMK